MATVARHDFNALMLRKINVSSSLCWPVKNKYSHYKVTMVRRQSLTLATLSLNKYIELRKTLSNFSTVFRGFGPVGSHNLEATTGVNENVQPQKSRINRTGSFKVQS